MRVKRSGKVRRTPTDRKPVYVSVGHLMTLGDAVRVTLPCCTKYRVPEPARLAGQLLRGLTTYQVASRLAGSRGLQATS